MTASPLSDMSGADKTLQELDTAAKASLLERVLAPAGSTLPPVRLLVVLAHPDDEVLALGARLERLSAGRLLTVTDGTPRNGEDARHHGFPTLESYREARRTELRDARAHAGLPVAVAEPFPAVPTVADQEASLHLIALTQGIRTAMEVFKPEAILTTTPAPLPCTQPCS